MAKLMQGNTGNAKQQEQQTSKVAAEVQNFWAKGLIYTSDPVQRAFGRMMQGFYHDAPTSVVMRLFAEFLLAMRQDLGDDRTTISPLEIWAPKLNDIFSSLDKFGLNADSFETLASSSDWEIPWLGTELEHRPGEGGWGTTP